MTLNIIAVREEKEEHLIRKIFDKRYNNEKFSPDDTGRSFPFIIHFSLENSL